MGFEDSIYSSLTYLQNSSELCVDYELFHKDFSNFIEKISTAEIIESKYVKCANYIYPIYADAVTERIEITSGLIKNQYYLSCTIKRK